VRKEELKEVKDEEMKPEEGVARWFD